MQITQRFDQIGPSLDGTAAVSGGTPVVAVTEATIEGDRQGVQIVNHSASYVLWFKFTKLGAAAPTISSTSKHGSVQPASHLTIGAGKNIQIWVLSADASNSVAFTAIALR